MNPCLLHWQADSVLLSHQGSSLLLYPRTETISVSCVKHAGTGSSLVVQERAYGNMRVLWPGCCKPETGGIPCSHSESPSQQSACEQRAPSSMGEVRTGWEGGMDPCPFKNPFISKQKVRKWMSSPNRSSSTFARRDRLGRHRAPPAIVKGAPSPSSGLGLGQSSPTASLQILGHRHGKLVGTGWNYGDIIKEKTQHRETMACIRGRQKENTLC